MIAGLGERSATLTVRGERDLVDTLLPPGFLLLCIACISVSPYIGIPSITFSLTGSPVMTASLPPKKEVTYDSPLTLTCSATGIDISWQWYQNGTQIEDTTGMSEPVGQGILHPKLPCWILF